MAITLCYLGACFWYIPQIDDFSMFWSQSADWRWRQKEAGMLVAFVETLACIVLLRVGEVLSLLFLAEMGILGMQRRDTEFFVVTWEYRYCACFGVYVSRSQKFFRLFLRKLNKTGLLKEVVLGEGCLWMVFFQWFLTADLNLHCIVNNPQCLMAPAYFWCRSNSARHNTRGVKPAPHMRCRV